MNQKEYCVCHFILNVKTREKLEAGFDPTAFIQTALVLTVQYILQERAINKKPQAGFDLTAVIQTALLFKVQYILQETVIN